jgi:hypothetical protein
MFFYMVHLSMARTRPYINIVQTREKAGLKEEDMEIRVTNFSVEDRH